MTASHPIPRLLVPRMFYFLLFSALSFVIPYLAIYYEHIGIEEGRIGVLLAILPLGALFCAPMWGLIADATQQHKRLLIVAVIGAIGAMMMVSRTTRFAALVPLVMTYAFFASPIIPLIDNTTLELLGGHRDQYGRQRLWGSVGWGLSSPVVGLVLDRYGLSWAFHGYCLLMTLVLATAWHLPVSHSRIGIRLGPNLRVILASQQWRYFLAAVYIGGIGLAMMHQYLFLYLNGLGFSKLFMGLMMVVSTGSEVPVMLGSAWLIARFGTRPLLVLALTLFALRALAYSYARSGEMFLLIQLMHGMTFGLLWVAAVSHARSIAPQGMGATAQGLLSGTLLGLGASSGSIIGGRLFQTLGPALMYRWASAILLTGLVFLALARRAQTKRRREASNT